MSRPFPADEPFLRGYHAPLSAECDAANLQVTGELPRQLLGTLCRNGPNPQFAPRGPYHSFGGDGMLHAFHSEKGRVSCRNRWVRTLKWVLEHAEGEGLSDAFGTLVGSDPRIVALDSTVANTNIVWHAGRLIALEEAHAPLEVDPQTLAPKGDHHLRWQAHRPDDGASQARPCDSRDGLSRLLGRRRVQCRHDAARGRQGRLSHPLRALHGAGREQGARLRGHAQPHHLPIFPLTGSMARAMTGLPPFAWEPDLGTRIGIMPRGGSVADLRWFTGDPSYVIHPMNAFDAEDGSVVCNMVKHGVAPLFPKPDGAPTGPKAPEAALLRWRFDLAANSNTFREQPLDDRPAEFPRLDERFSVRPYRLGYLNSTKGLAAGRTERERWGLAHTDLHSSNRVSWQPEAGDACGEPAFVPRSAEAAEGDGWLLSVVWRARENRSDLAVFNAADLAAGPVALAHLSHRVPAGFHGNWRAGGSLAVN